MRSYIGVLTTTCILAFSLTISFEAQVADAQLKPDTFSTLKNLKLLAKLKGLKDLSKTSPNLKNFDLNELKKSFGFRNRSRAIDAPNLPNPSINKPLTEQEIDELDSSVFIVQFINFIFTGRFDGQTEIGDELDENNLDAILGLGIQLYITIISLDDYPPEDAADVLADLLRLKEILATNGSTGILFKEIKKYLTYDVAVSLLQVYAAFNSEFWAQNFQAYLITEFLGGLGDGTPCKIHSAAWFNDIVNGEEYAIYMLDAIAKLPPGLTQGNINWVGSIETCKDVRTPTYDPYFEKFPIKGKYCRADIGFPIEQVAGDLPIDDTIGLNYGLCVSSYCDTDQVASLVSNSLKLFSVFKYSWVKQVECLEESYELPTANLVWIILLSILTGFVIFCTLFDVVLRIVEFAKGSNVPEDPDVILAKKEIVGEGVVRTKKPKQKPKLVKFFTECSFYTNTEKLFRTDNGGKITCLNGVRMFSMLWIIFGHTYNYIANRDKFFLLDNVFALQKLNEELYAQIIINGVFGVDTFFLMSAFLLTMSLLSKLEKHGRLTPFEWAYYYIHRYWRLMPPFMIIVIINIYVAPYMLSGPLLNPDTFPPYNEECREYWWAFLIFLNNFIPEGRGSFCMSYLWYIPNDYQFYALTPIAVYLLFKFPKAAKFLLGALLMATLCTMAFLAADVYVSRKKNIVDVLLDMWVDVYIKPYCRASPWIIGIVLGYIFFKYKKVKLDYITVAVGWILSTLFFASVLFGGYTNHAPDARRMEVWEFALFFSLTKLCWALGVAWVIFACHYGYGGVVNSILSRKAYLPITRLSFCAYLIHPTMMLYYYFLQEQLFHATFYTLIYMAIGHIVMTFMLSYFYSMIFELPFVALERLIYSPKGSSH